AGDRIRGEPEELSSRNLTLMHGSSRSQVVGMAGGVTPRTYGNRAAASNSGPRPGGDCSFRHV
ncbi:MAG TPA: hypothetical protein VIG47_05305, partial [Gemmatimonadaceae bacterium]